MGKLVFDLCMWTRGLREVGVLRPGHWNSRKLLSPQSCSHSLLSSFCKHGIDKCSCGHWRSQERQSSWFSTLEISSALSPGRCISWLLSKGSLVKLTTVSSSTLLQCHQCSWHFYRDAEGSGICLLWGKTERLGAVYPGKEHPERIFSQCLAVYKGWVSRAWALFSGPQRQDKMHWAQGRAQEVPSWTWGKPIIWDFWSTESDCPERLWSMSLFSGETPKLLRCTPVQHDGEGVLH